MHDSTEASSKRILFVDDDPQVRASLARCARVWGYQADVAASAEEAFALLEAWFYSVVVTDIHMPGVGGRVLLDRLPDLSRDTTCVVMTGDATISGPLPVAADDLHVLAKPVELDVLQPLLARLTGLAAAHKEFHLITARATAQLRALIVEDSETDAAVLSRILRNSSVCPDAVVATTLAGALDRLRREKFDIVLVDLQLPDSAGLVTVRGILNAAPHLPLVVVSGNDDDNLAHRAIEAGAQDYLVKGDLGRALVGRVLRHAVERKKIEARLMHLATRDPLTGLVNRLFFRERVASALARSTRTRSPFAVVVVEIDGFRAVNDSLGQEAGDALLHLVAERLTAELGNSEVVARLGGDEFAVLLEGIADLAEAMAIAELCRRSLSQPFHLAVGYVSISVCMGLALYPDAGETVDALLTAANAAMYRTKCLGLDEVSVFSAELHAQSLENYRIEQRLRSALSENEFHLVFQPQVSARETGKIVGAEVLLRWTPRGEKPISPAVFIPLLERSGQIVEVGRWVLHEACVWRAKMLEAGAPLERLSVNVSARQLERPEFLHEVQSICQEFSLKEGELELEITEATLVRQATVAEATIRELRSMGVRFSLDDFGTGFSSMNYLRDFPVDTLKVDQSFVRRLTGDAKSLVLATAIFDLGRGLGMETVAEGVETDAELAVVCDLGADIIQGYLTGRPAAPEAFLETLLRSFRRAD